MHARSDASPAGSTSQILQPSQTADAAYGCVDWYQYDCVPRAASSPEQGTTARISLAVAPAAALAAAATLLDSVISDQRELRSA